MFLGVSQEIWHDVVHRLRSMWPLGVVGELSDMVTRIRSSVHRRSFVVDRSFTLRGVLCILI